MKNKAMKDDNDMLIIVVNMHNVLVVCFVCGIVHCAYLLRVLAYRVLLVLYPLFLYRCNM